MAVGNHTLPSNILDTCSEGFFYCMGKWSSTVTGGLYWFMALFAFVIIIFLASLRFGTVKAFGFASFVGMMGAVWLSILQFIPWWLGSTFIIVGIIGLTVMFISEK